MINTNIEKAIEIVKKEMAHVPFRHFSILQTLLDYIDKAEKIRKDKGICPHGKKHLYQYCRECSTQMINDEYTHVQELQAKLAALKKKEKATVKGIAKALGDCWSGLRKNFAEIYTTRDSPDFLKIARVICDKLRFIEKR